MLGPCTWHLYSNSWDKFKFENLSLNIEIRKRKKEKEKNKKGSYEAWFSVLTHLDFTVAWPKFQIAAPTTWAHSSASAASERRCSRLVRWVVVPTGRMDQHARTHCQDGSHWSASQIMLHPPLVSYVWTPNVSFAYLLTTLCACRCD
jgi:hypothetical protein